MTGQGRTESHRALHGLEESRREARREDMRDAPLVKADHPLEEEARREGRELLRAGRQRGGQARGRGPRNGFEDLRAAAEARYGRDLAEVTLSDTARSRDAADRLEAEAFTVGNEIHMGEGRGSAETAAHEIVHAVQQTGGAAGPNPVTAAPTAVARQEKRKKKPALYYGADAALYESLKKEGFILEPEPEQGPLVYTLPSGTTVKLDEDFMARFRQENLFLIPLGADILIQEPLLPLPGFQTQIIVPNFPTFRMDAGPKPEQPPLPKPKPKATPAQKAYWAFSKNREEKAEELGVESGDQVVHAIQPGVLDRYPGVFTAEELNDSGNLRGLGHKSSTGMHATAQWNIWNQCYQQLDAALKQVGAKPGSPQYDAIVRKYIEDYRDGMDHQYGDLYTNNPHPEPGEFLETSKGQAMRAWSNRQLMAAGKAPVQMPGHAPTEWEQSPDRRLYEYKPFYHPQTGDLIGYSRESMGYFEIRDRGGKIIQSAEIPLEPILGQQTVNALFELAVSLVPIASEAQDVNDLTRGVSITGEKLDTGDRVMAGVGLLIPIGSAGTLRAAGKVLDAVDMAKDLSRLSGHSSGHIMAMFRASGHLDDANLTRFQKVVDDVAATGKVSPDDLKFLNAVSEKLKKPIAEAKAAAKANPPKPKPSGKKAETPGPAKQPDPSGAAKEPEESFADLIDTEAMSKDPWWTDRLSRAREFDIGGYHDLTSAGEFGRLFDGLDSDEAIQNLFFRDTFKVGRTSDMIKGNPAIALTPRIHKMIRNLKSAGIQGLTGREVLQHHMDELWRTGEVPHEVMITLQRESIKFLELLKLD